METVGYIILLSASAFILYGFYRILKYMLDDIRNNDD